MNKERQAFGICAVNNFIYVAGGAKTTQFDYDKTTERYDVIHDKWEILETCELPTRQFA